MKLLVLSIGLLTGAALAASPSEGDIHRNPQTAHLIFRSVTTPDLYYLNVKADGNVVRTKDFELDIGLIDAPDYLAYSLCKFVTPDPVEITTQLAADNITTQLVLDPPQPVYKVSCEGYCVVWYGECFDAHGQPTGPCCNGFCAANRCRPWSDGR